MVQERLGHSTIAITADTYSHVAAHLQREAAASFDEALASSLETREIVERRNIVHGNVTGA